MIKLRKGGPQVGRLQVETRPTGTIGCSIKIDNVFCVWSERRYQLRLQGVRGVLGSRLSSWMIETAAMKAND